MNQSAPAVPRGMIFNIQRFSIHDGPGIRTTVFLKGCNLRCPWCHNPESQRMTPEIEFFPEKCIACGGCVEICPEGAQRLEGSRRMYLRDLCRACGACTRECFSGALLLSGEERTAEQVLAEIDKDAGYYQSSGGGVTFSGGEPLLQPEFLKALLDASHRRGYHCAVDTAGNVPWERFVTVRPFTDLFLYDIKALDEGIHRRVTGARNRLILENLSRLAKTGQEIWVRIPLVAGVNDATEEIEAIARMLAPLNSVRRVEILPYHSLGSEKYACLGREYPANGYRAPSHQRIEQILSVFQSQGISARCME